MHKQICALVMCAAILPLSQGHASEACPTEDRAMEFTVESSVPVEEAWRLWTTQDGLQQFLAPEAVIDPRVGGVFSIHFDPSRPEGERGADNMEITVFEPMHRLAFTWNAPTTFPEARRQRAIVAVRFAAIDDEHTRVALRHDSFGSGAEWDATFEYFLTGWGQSVMPRFLYVSENGGPVLESAVAAPVRDPNGARILCYAETGE